MDDILVMWSHGMERLQEFLSRVNSLRSSIQFTLEMESGNLLPFFDVLVYRRGTAFLTKAYRKPTHTGHCLHFILIILTLREEWCTVTSVEPKPSAKKSKNISQD
jgi:hypothetical protein